MAKKHADAGKKNEQEIITDASQFEGMVHWHKMFEKTLEHRIIEIIKGLWRFHHKRGAGTPFERSVVWGGSAAASLLLFNPHPPMVVRNYFNLTVRCNRILFPKHSGRQIHVSAVI